MFQQIKQIPNLKLVVITTVVVLALSIGGFMVISRGSSQKTEVELTSTPTPTEEPTPTEPEEEESPTPTKKATVTVKPTVKPTIKPSATPTKPAATSTPAPTSAPTNTPVPTATPIPPDTTPPTISMTGPADGSTVDFNNFCFPAYIQDTVSTTSDIQARYRFDSPTWSEWGSEFAPCYSNIANGSHTFSIQARDKAGNVKEETRIFTVNKTN